MNLTTREQNDVTVIGLAGDLTHECAGRFHEAVDKAFSQGRRDFIIDLKQLGGIDSAGLEAFTATQRRCEEQLGMVRFCSPDAAVRKIFEMTRLDRTFEVYDQLEEALASFK
ncbi:MAG: STAS domain-containing protein [Phycisphaerae bacterium]|jgi:anti-sigma B factor antagonist